MDSEDERTRRKLLKAGMLLFVISLIFAFPLPIYANPRMAVTAHVIGVLESLFIVVLGLIWRDLRLGDRTKAATFWMRLVGGYANWIACLLASVWGASRITPVAGAGYHALPWQENIVAVMLSAVGLLDVVAGVLIVWGLRGVLKE